MSLPTLEPRRVVQHRFGVRMITQLQRIFGTTPPLVYLACPYSHHDRAVRVARFEAVNKAAAELMLRGEMVFSPISHTHPIAEAGALPTGWDFWQAFDEAYLKCSHKLVVLRMDGWRESKGVQGEMKIAQRLHLPVYFMEPHSHTTDPTLVSQWT